MSDAVAHFVKAPSQIEISTRLTREAYLLAGRLAELLRTSLPNSESSVSEGQSFLQTLFESVAEGRPIESWSRNVMERTPEGAPHPLDRLAERLKLSPSELELLLLAGLAEEHEGLAAVFRTLHSRGEPRATIGLAAQLFSKDQSDRRDLRVLIETGNVIRSGALRVVGEGPFFERSIIVADSLWSALHGVDVWPTSVVKLNGSTSGTGLEEWFETSVAQRAVLALRQSETCTVLVSGDSDDTAFNRAFALVAHAGSDPVGIMIHPSLVPGTEKLIQMHALARGVVPILKLTVPDGADTRDLPTFDSFPGVIVASGRSGGICSPAHRPLIDVPVERLLPAARQRMWSAAIPNMKSNAPFLAARYPVEPETASAVAGDLQFVSDLENRDSTVDDVSTSMRARGGVSVSAGVRFLRPQANWKDLVLNSDRLDQLREAVSRLELQARVFDEWGFLRERTGARGVRLLFTGPPGTGKTLAAEVLANALKIDLLVVDLSRVVSKWIGETEKNLSSVFDAAQRGQAALFFDEADALFGKRTEVTDAHDRYANLETAYLLTRLEQFEGLAILATNLRQNIDAAFLRRLEFVVDFEEPDREERLALWKCHLPKDAPLADDVNLSELALLYPVVGGVIRNAAVAAGFLAAADGVPIDRRHFVRAVRREYTKASRSFPGAPIGLAV